MSLKSSDMDATTPRRDVAKSEDALKVLGRVADAFDHPSSHEIHKEIRLIVHAIKTHRPQTVRPLSVVRSAVFVILTQFPLQSYSSQDSQSQYARFARCDSSFDISYDGDVELVRLAGAAIEEPTASYASEETVAGHSRCYENPRSPSEKTLQQDDMLHDITKMLLASSPLDRLNYLARIELKNMGWFERTSVFPFTLTFCSCA
ncbi:hypothetical protein PAXINDRAFT_14299 [Paxillus involutus ATCC 200175]|uniref:Uncharacterized protein n=1 Tax=Paxillus involutus ATCC 200175 TaxID=664439 RepID=A0A0C9U039_PAXIN|nr:hypothetical protein PAXINDRAFT_14299 [Paxillus involutus ATCC 200175]